MSGSRDISSHLEELTFPLDDTPGPAIPLSDAETDRVVRSVLARTLCKPVEPAVRRSVHRRTRLLILAAALLLVAAAAAASAWVTHRPALRDDPTLPPTSIEHHPSLEPMILFNEAKETARDVAPATSASAAPTPVSSPATIAKRRVDLLREANRLRAGQQWEQAERAYRRVIVEYPNTAEAYAAQVAAAAIRLEHLRDPEGARSLYESAQRSRPEGGLSEEVEYGMAESHRRAGNEEAEMRALRAFLAHHPESVLRAKAVSRLGELEKKRRDGRE